MTILDRLSNWKETGAISSAQYEAIATVVRKDRFSVFFELNAMLYLGVVSLVAGIAWIIQTYAAGIGDAAIVSGLTLIFAISFYYCFSRRAPFSTDPVDSPTLAFDYMLYLACLTFALDIGYVETRFQLLQSHWDYYLLVSAGLFFALAYRFDNRLVLSLGLSTLGAWFGIRSARMNVWVGESIRVPSLVYSTLVMAAGTLISTREIKRHFTDTYFHVGSLVLFVALISGVIDKTHWWYPAGVLVSAAGAIAGGIRFGKFAFVMYGIVFSYVAISIQLLRSLGVSETGALTYFLISGSLVTISVLWLARRPGGYA